MLRVNNVLGGVWTVWVLLAALQLLALVGGAAGEGVAVSQGVGVGVSDSGLDSSSSLSGLRASVAQAMEEAKLPACTNDMSCAVNGKVKCSCPSPSHCRLGAGGDGQCAMYT